jgi:hypothetical protein
MTKVSAMAELEELWDEVAVAVRDAISDAH